MTESPTAPLAGLWQPIPLQKMFYGPHAVRTHLRASLPTPTSRAFIITNASLATHTRLIQLTESLLGPAHHAGTYARIRQHAPVAQLDEAAARVRADPRIDTLVSVGGGSPIDAAKAISQRVHDATGRFLHHVSVPTTLSAAECSFLAGYTRADGTKALLRDAGLACAVILYDATFARETPARLWLATGVRALDHAVELMGHGAAAEAPCKALCVAAVRDLFAYLPRYRADPGDEAVITKCQLAAFMSLYAMGQGVPGGIGLSHALGYALGSPYGIPHGVTSCLTLAKVVRLRAAADAGFAREMARILPVGGTEPSGDARTDAELVAAAIERLVEELGLRTSLREYGVGEEEVPTIAKAGTGEEEGELYEKVVALVKSLY